MRVSRIAFTFAAAVVAAAIAGLAPAGTVTTAPSAQSYFGKTSKGMFVQLDLRGQVLTKHSFIDGVLWHTCTPGFHCTKKRWPTDVISLNPYKEIPFSGNRISYHRVVKDANWWLEARVEQGGRVISGWVRQSNHAPGYTPEDSGKVFFTARLWASSEGAAWTGKTSDGKPLTMSVGYRNWDADVPFTVNELSRPLTCREPGGVASTHQVTIPKVEGAMRGLYWRSDRKYQYPAHTGVPARGSVTTPEGVAVQATVNVTKLAPQGSGLAATGSLKLEGTGADYACQPVTTTFTVRPR